MDSVWGGERWLALRVQGLRCAEGVDSWVPGDDIGVDGGPQLTVGGCVYVGTVEEEEEELQSCVVVDRVG